jgi:hypothetical protein
MEAAAGFAGRLHWNEEAMAEFKLSIAMVPPQLWGENLRKYLSRTEWNKIRESIFTISPNCTICEAEVVGAARHAHEEWVYEIRRRPRTGKATLVGVRTICRTCHFVEHPGFVNAMIAKGQFTADIRKTLRKHFCSVNGCKPADCRRHEDEADARFLEFLRIKCWRIDFGPYAGLVEAASGGTQTPAR